jgi:hypothetical protein
MKNEVKEAQNLTETLAAIQKQLAALSERVAALETVTGQAPATSADATADAVEVVPGGQVAPEAGAATGSAPVASGAPDTTPEEEAPADGTLADGTLADGTPAAELDEELLLVLSAAVAAFLGKRPRIRQVRLVNSATWAQQGRAGIHASHAFAVYSRSGAAS